MRLRETEAKAAAVGAFGVTSTPGIFTSA